MRIKSASRRIGRPHEEDAVMNDVVVATATIPFIVGMGVNTRGC
jgi:hypothetical protein